MRTFKLIGLLTVAVLILSACKSIQPPILPAAGQNELAISITGSNDSKYTADITIAGNRSVTFTDEDDIWYYDVPDTEQEFALAETLNGNIIWVHIHLHESKKPKN